jgi:PhzF family phenazine biosynthesis protein
MEQYIMKIKIYQVDAFAQKLFSGNPAAYCPLDSWPDDSVLQAIAEENNLSETAFTVPTEDGHQIRWFTPNAEVDLCGHATLAAAFIIFQQLEKPKTQITFQSNSGELKVEKNEAKLTLDFPALAYEPTQESDSILKKIGISAEEVYESKFDLLCVLEDPAQVEKARPNLKAMADLKYRGVILTARANDSDIYSRCFYPRVNVDEDPVTGSAHCVIAPY